ncbi:MAG: response regulator [Bacteroidetes bacterium]|nr:MAG: response regulator [Bacteroidota bacterium]REK00672.1 MAG: response regulator [Bacteroidota bacterium]REK35206.1 MAG: response regulator [Bacteroidota bacterium]REK48283.1 MAG: response regulator [Bacteroidota bacterium]
MNRFKYKIWDFKNVLLIDDNEADNHVNKSILLKNDYALDVHCCTSSDEGIAYLESCMKTSKEIPDLIFLDIIMPKVDGFGFLNEFAKLDRRIRNYTSIVMLTSSTDLIDYYRAIRNPYVLSYLKKPLNIFELRALAA